MSLYLLDTNVISEARKGARANPGVQAFFQRVRPSIRFLAAQTIGELARGVEKLRLRGDREQANSIEKWLDAVLFEYADRIIPFDAECAQIWGRYTAADEQNSTDKQLAAISTMCGLVVVTRNVRHFASTGVALENPFT